MRIRIRHETIYRYSEPVRSAIQLLRLTPRANNAQFVRKWRVTLDADARLDRSEDAYGNITHLAFIDGPYEQLSILVEGEVETNDTSGIVSGGAERLSERLFLRETAKTAPSPEIRQLAQDAMASEGGDLLAGLHKINARLHDEIKFIVGATNSSTSAAEAFAEQAGVCQDFAHIFVSAARAVGIPARYVSGYYLRTDREAQDAGHAWAEAHVASIGWVAFDPANGVCSTERHVRTAIGPDSDAAAPIRGTRTGGNTEALSVEVHVAAGDIGLPGTRKASQSQSQQQ